MNIVGRTIYEDPMMRVEYDGLDMQIRVEYRNRASITWFEIASLLFLTLLIALSLLKTYPQAGWWISVIIFLLAAYFSLHLLWRLRGWERLTLRHNGELLYEHGIDVVGEQRFARRIYRLDMMYSLAVANETYFQTHPKYPKWLWLRSYRRKIHRRWLQGTLAFYHGPSGQGKGDHRMLGRLDYKQARRLLHYIERYVARHHPIVDRGQLFGL